MRGFKVFAGRRLSRTTLLGLIGLAAAFEANAHWEPQLQLSGTPASSDVAGTAYSFKPTASGWTGRRLTYSINGKPAWANFNTSTGQLSGTPTAANVGTTAAISIRASNGFTTAYLAPFAIKITTPVNSTPTITGTPAASVNSGTGYSFTPGASDAIGAPLSFKIQNLPSWASFNPLTGQLSGTPAAANVGTYSNIIISVSDGVASASLPAFGIAVNATSNGTATVTWTPPVANTDGSAITNLAGYKIYYGTVSNNLNQSIKLTNTGLTAYTLSNLTSGTWYFGVTAVTTAGTESTLSNVAKKSIQ